MVFSEEERRQRLLLDIGERNVIKLLQIYRLEKLRRLLRHFRGKQ